MDCVRNGMLRTDCARNDVLIVLELYHECVSEEGLCLEY